VPVEVLGVVPVEVLGVVRVEVLGAVRGVIRVMSLVVSAHDSTCFFWKVDWRDQRWFTHAG